MDSYDSTVAKIVLSYFTNKTDIVKNEECVCCAQK